jgi:penicillin-binding protein 1A
MPRKANRKGRKPRPKKGSCLWRALFLLALIGVAVGGLAVTIYSLRASAYDLSEVGAMPERSLVLDLDGREIGRLHGENRITVSIDEVSPHFVDALLAREDSRFWSHPGVDIIGVVRAVVRNVTARRFREGASTLTQQLARNTFPLGGQTLDRKILELFVALRIERTFSKQSILEHYINRIYYGSGLYGVETASRAYFGKPAAELTVGEAAMMAGLIRSPNRFSPLRNPEGARRERDTVLARMEDLGKITPAEGAVAREEVVRAPTRKPSGFQENYAMDAVRRELDILLEDRQVEGGGLRIYTTLDPALQRAAETALEKQLQAVEGRAGYPHLKRGPTAEPDADPPYLQGAVVVIDHRSGGLRAIVGGRDYRESKFNRALHAERQVGSTFKPFVYLSAFERGLLPTTLIDDGPIRPGEVRGAPGWSPGNSDGTFAGSLPAAQGLIRSRNTMTVRVGERGGLAGVIATAGEVGFGAQLPRQPAVYLGGFEATPLALGSAYTVLANRGVRRQTYLIERIDDPWGRPLYRAAHVESRVVEEADAWMVTEALEQVFEGGTASSASALGWKAPAAGKTGTTDDYRDAWFAGYTSSLTCVVWVGFDTPKTIESRGFGATLALPTWVAVMRAAEERRYPRKAFAAPRGLRQTEVCAVSGSLAHSGCRAAGTARGIALPGERIPDDRCRTHSEREPGLFQRWFR